MSLLPRSAFLIQLFCTLSMTGIIWFVQLVHYPLFEQVAPASFVHYEARHSTRTGWIVAPLMCLELGTSVIFLVARTRPASMTEYSPWLGAALVFIIWMSTAFIQVPLHRQLAAGFDPAVLVYLVRTNWIRTFAWTARSILLLQWTARMMKFNS